VARGTANNEPIVSQAQTEAFDEGYDRTFGKDRKPTRGRWVFDVAQQKLVPVDEYVAPSSDAKDALIMAGRFYEGTQAIDGADISTRRRHRDYMKANGLAPADDFSPGWYAKVKKAEQDEARRQRREVIARKMHEIEKP